MIAGKVVVVAGYGVKGCSFTDGGRCAGDQVDPSTLYKRDGGFESPT